MTHGDDTGLMLPPKLAPVQVNCNEHKSLCSKYGVSGCPTVQWLPKGSLEPKKYEGSRSAEALLSL